VMNQVARSYENVDARIRGAEATLTYSVTDRLFASGDVTLTRGTQTIDPTKSILSSNLAEIHPPIGAVRLRYDRAVVYGEAEVRMAARHTKITTDRNSRCRTTAF
jgi:outer membrane receptor protein involved in Fe transport